MNPKVRSQIASYGVSISCVGLATSLHLLARPILGDNVPFLTFYPAVFVAAVFTRLAPSLLAVALSALAAAYWFIPPANTLSIGEPAHWMSLSLFTIFGAGIAWMGETRHRRSEQIAEERERFSVTLASIGDGVIVTDKNARVMFLNAIAEQLTGWSNADAQGKSLEIVFPIQNEQTREPTENPVIRALREGRIVGLANHTVLITKNSSERAIDDSAAPIRDHEGNVLGVVLVFRDVSRERAAQLEKARLAAIVDSSDDAIIGQSFEGVVTDWNAGAERLFGHKAEEVIGQSLFSTIVPPDRTVELLDALKRVQQGERITPFESIRQHRDGHLIPVAIRISPIQNSEGEVIGASAIDRDISQQRAAEMRRNARLAVTQILAQEQSIEKSVVEILRTVGSALSWDAGAYWTVSDEGDAIHCREFWERPGRNLAAFREATLESDFGPHTDLPGRVWTSQEPLWITDVTTGSNFPRAHAAKADGLLSGFGWPITFDQKCLGIVEWFSHTRLEPDEDLVEMLTTICGQIGQFIERRRAEIDLRKSEGVLNDFFENAAVGLHWVGADGTILRANQAELDLLGYAREEYVGRHIAELHADQNVIDMILTCLTSGEVVHDCEARLRCKDGSIRHVLIDSNVLFDDGKFIHTRCFTRDITDRKLAQTRLHESEERLTLAVEAGHMGTWEWNIAQNKVIWSTTLEAIHGLSPGSFPGTFEAYQQDIHPEDRARVLKTIQRTVEEHTEHHLEYRILWPDGSLHWLEAHGKLLTDDAGNPVRLVGVCSDVTQRNQMEQSLRFLAEASKSLSALIDYKSTLQKVAHLAVPGFADWCAVDMLDADGLLQRVAVAHINPDKVQLAEQLYNRYPSPPDAPQGITHVLRTGEAELVTRIGRDMLQAAAQDADHLKILLDLDLKSYICVPLSVKGKILGAISFVSAESGRLYGPEDLGLAEDLAHRAAIAVENARLYQEVRDADRRKDEFLAMLAHELRNPLAPIRSGLDILAMDGGNQNETIHLMQEQVEHVVRLVDDLLDVSRIMQGKIDLRKEPTELAAVIHRSVNAVRPLVETHHQNLSLSLPEEPIWLHVDPVRLVQVLENLLNNASKYTDSGGHIELSARPEGNAAVICVKDTGIGIEPELLPKVFELFTQSSRSLDRSQGGLGIGLTLVERLLDMHDGTISAHSEGIGKGSTFTVRLPIVKPVEIAKAPAQQPANARSRRILVVDDNVGAARMLAMLLRKLGDHHVETAHDGKSAIAKVKESHPEIVLLDIGLPDMDGFQVGKTIREFPEFNGTLLVALTGYGQTEARQKSKQIGFDEHLVKPPSIDQMREVLAHAKLAK